MKDNGNGLMLLQHRFRILPDSEMVKKRFAPKAENTILTCVVIRIVL